MDKVRRNDWPELRRDMQSLLRLKIAFKASDAYPLIYETLIDKMEKREIEITLNKCKF